MNQHCFVNTPSPNPAEYYERCLQLYSSWQEELNKIAFEQLPATEKVDYLLFKNQLDKDAYFMRIRQKEFEEVAYVTDFATPLYNFIRQRRRGANVNATVLAKSFDEALKATAGAKDKVSKAAPFPSWQKAEKAGDVGRSAARKPGESFNFYTGYDPEFSWWVKAPYDTLATTLKAYEDFLKKHYVNTSVKDDGSGIIGKPIGREALIKSLQSEFIAYTPEEIA